MVWLTGGGFVEGTKTGNGAYDPAGLIKASQVSGSEGIIFVSPNYRVSLFITIISTILMRVTRLARRFWMAGWSYSLLKWHSKCCPL